MDKPSRLDEFDVDFENTGEFVAWRYKDIINVISETLPNEDKVVAKEQRSPQDLSSEIRTKMTDPNSSAVLRRLMSSIQSLPRSMSTLNSSFASAVSPENVHFDFIWGMLYLNLKLSYSSTDKLKRTVEWLGNLRRIVELFNRCLVACDDPNEPRLAIVEIYDHMLTMLGENLLHLRSCSTDEEVLKAWPQVNGQLQDHFAAMDATVRHLNEITTYSRTNLEQAVKHLSIRNTAVPVSEEHAEFPCVRVPFMQNDRFFGRKEAIRNITEHLTPNKAVSELRTFTLYGRRGVGKSEIALQYAYENPSGFDAIFWVRCETSVSLRQSFTDIAVHLKLPGADRNGHHEENLLSVQKWLKLTQRNWLLIFDNAERESLMRGYWPSGAKGALLITSRKHYKFMRDSQRKGCTIKPLDEAQRFDLLMLLLGEDWQNLHTQGLLPQSEIKAAKTLLKKTGGLMLAIQQAAVSINNTDIGGATIAGTLDIFNSTSQQLPERPESERSEIIHTLDALWNMNFSILTLNARNLLSVLAMLSPDSTLIDLFLPKNQSALDGKLSFIRQHTSEDGDALEFPLAKAISSPTLDSALSELLQKGLIRRDNRIISVHRIVQEAMNYQSIEDLQASFDAAVSIVYEAFPKAWTGEALHNQWPVCQTYITHGVHICMKYTDCANPSIRVHIEPTEAFTALMANCGWYLYEIGDYETCLQLVNTASNACKDKNSVRFANLRNTAGTCYFDMNKLQECRRDYEIALAIQEAETNNNDVKMSYMLHNMGNLETACSRLEEAEEYFTKAIKSRTEQGDPAAFQLALTSLCMARLYFLWGTYEEARKYLSTSESLFVRISGADTHLLSFVHYLYGNLEFALGHWTTAKRSYEDALTIALKETPIHFITSAIYYKLGCVELAMGGHTTAKIHLDKALAIAELRSPSRDDGTIARILFKMAKVLENDINGHQVAQDLRTRAGVAKVTIKGMGGGHILQLMDEDGNVDLDDEDDAFDSLVPIFFR